MTTPSLEQTAQMLVAAGKGILAADESTSTIGKRFGAAGIPSTAETRCAYREMLFTAPDLSEFVSGVILYDETIRQSGSGGERLAEMLVRSGIMPGIKVDTGAKPLAGCPGETVTEGLDGLRERLQEYRALGPRFAKWRTVMHVDDHLSSGTCVEVNAHALGRYAALCQEDGLVPIVEPEVLMDGAHTLARAETVTSQVLDRVFRALHIQRVVPEASGTSNMKFMMNGALTIATRDGATIEMAEEAGEENLFLFGLTAAQVAGSRDWYSARWHYEREPETRAALDLIFADHFSQNEPGVFAPLRETLLTRDHYMHLADLASYLEADRRLCDLYADANGWTRKAILNVASSGKFSSDRTIAEYAADIWKATPCPVE